MTARRAPAPPRRFKSLRKVAVYEREVMASPVALSTFSEQPALGLSSTSTQARVQIAPLAIASASVKQFMAESRPCCDMAAKTCALIRSSSAMSNVDPQSVARPMA